MKKQPKSQFNPSADGQKHEKMYGDLASWWHLLSSPEEYAEEASFFHKVFIDSTGHPPQTMLELGSGGGNNAFHLKKYFQMTLADLSAGMLAMSQQLNPECEHLEGDMRTLRIDRLFDAVFIHDAICYMTTPEDLRRAFDTAFAHCRPGGAGTRFAGGLAGKGRLLVTADCGANIAFVKQASASLALPEVTSVSSPRNRCRSLKSVTPCGGTSPRCRRGPRYYSEQAWYRPGRSAAEECSAPGAW